MWVGLIECLFGIFLWFKYPGWVCSVVCARDVCKQFQGGVLLWCFRPVEKCCGKLVLAGVLLGGLVVDRFLGMCGGGVGGFESVCVCTTHTCSADADR